MVLIGYDALRKLFNSYECTSVGNLGDLNLESLPKENNDLLLEVFNCTTRSTFFLITALSRKVMLSCLCTPFGVDVTIVVALRALFGYLVSASVNGAGGFYSMLC